VPRHSRHQDGAGMPGMSRTQRNETRRGS
jgi:hypothetical protein